MGLDGIELVIRFEDAFGIVIPDKVAVQLTTPGEVTDYLLAQLNLSNEPSCLSQQAFYFLRRKLELSHDISRRDIRPGTLLQNVIPIQKRRLVWESLKSQIGPRAIPDLSRPIWLATLLSLSTFLAFIVGVIQAWNTSSFESALFFGLFMMLTVGYCSAVITLPFKRHFRRGYQRAGDIAKYLSINSPHSFKRESKGWTREQVASVVTEIIKDQLGREDFTEDSHFLNDLHID